MPPNNPMSVWGNEKTMNLNTLLLSNIQASPYFKINLFELKTYHEVIDEIYYKVGHLEPWEKGSRKTAGQTGMCGGVRGVGAGGVVSSAYCLLYKLFTLKLTKKQVIGLINHKDSPFIRGLGFMYIRYTQPPADIWPWFEDYLDDDEEIDVKAGGGHVMTIGEVVRQWLVKLEWYSTLFPRIPVPIEKDIHARLKERPVVYRQADGGYDDEQATDRRGDGCYGSDSYQEDTYRHNNQRRDAGRHGDYTQDDDSNRRHDYRRDETRHGRHGDYDTGHCGEDRGSERGRYGHSISHHSSSATGRKPPPRPHNSTGYEHDLPGHRHARPQNERRRSRSPHLRADHHSRRSCSVSIGQQRRHCWSEERGSAGYRRDHREEGHQSSESRKHRHRSREERR